MALGLAEAGWDVAIHYGTSVTDAQQTILAIQALGRRAVALQADLAVESSVASLVSRCTEALGIPSCIVNNASLFLEDEAATLDPAVWDRQLAVNLRAPVLLAQGLARALPAGSSGAIVNIIDQRVLRPLPGFFSYAVSKEGLFAATRLLAQSLAPRVRVNGIGPGPVLPSTYQSEADFATEAASTLLRRPPAPSEIAEAVRFLLDAPSITGQMIAVDAGQHLAIPDAT